MEAKTKKLVKKKANFKNISPVKEILKPATKFPQVNVSRRTSKLPEGQVLSQLIVSTEFINLPKWNEKNANGPALKPVRRRRCGCGGDCINLGRHQTPFGHFSHEGDEGGDPLKRKKSPDKKRRGVSPAAKRSTFLKDNFLIKKCAAHPSAVCEPIPDPIGRTTGNAEKLTFQSGNGQNIDEKKDTKIPANGLGGKKHIKLDYVGNVKKDKNDKEKKREESSADFQPTHSVSLKRLTESRKYGVIPAKPGDGTDIWDNSELLQLRRQRIAEAKEFHRQRRRKYAICLLSSCRSLRKTHCPRPPEMREFIKQNLPGALMAKYNVFFEELLRELQGREVKPVTLPVLGKIIREPTPDIIRVPWIPKERQALSRAMASFPPTVRTIMAEVLRPLHTYMLVDVHQASSSLGVSEGLELKVLLTCWKGMARKSRHYLRQEWFFKAVNSIREAALSSGLSESRRHAVIHAFNNLLASKLQQVLIRSVEGFLSWLGSEEEPWIGPRVIIDLALADGDITLHPEEDEVYEAFIIFFDELTECVQLYRATWDEPLPPAIPKWRQRLAQEKAGDDNYKPLRPLQPHRETLAITLSEAQWTSLKSQAKESLEKAFEKARQFLNQIGVEFKAVLSGEIKKQIEVFMKSGANLKDFAFQIRSHSKYVEQASHVPAAATVSAFRLEYKPLRQSLLALCNNFVSVLRQKLINDHRKTTHKLLCEFKKIAGRMQETPKTTEELFTLMEAVEDARRITIRKLNDQVIEMTQRLQIILDVVLLTEEDLVMTAEVINWPARIRPIIEKSVEALEDFKQAFEEALVEKTAEVNQTLERIRELVSELEELGDVTQVNKYLREVRKINSRLEKVGKLVEWVNQEEALFKFPVAAFPDLQLLMKSLVPYENLFVLVMRWRRDEKHWMDGDFTILDPDFIDFETEELARSLSSLQRIFKAKFKLQALEGDPKKARMNFDDPNPDNLLGPLRITALTLGHIRSFKMNLPLVAVLCNKGLRPRHWVHLNKIAGFDITPNAGTSLRKVVKMNLDALLKQFEVISSGATREFNLETSLETMRQNWKTIKLRFTRHPILNVDVLEGLDDLSSVVEDHLIKTHAIKNSPYVGPFSDQVSAWESTLRYARRNVREWLKVQSLWVEMSPLFSMADLPSQLPKENKAFKEIDARWKAAMTVLMETNEVLQAASDEGKLSQASELLNGLELLQKAVHSYLHNKRSVFPRLFFVSNEELTSLVCEKDSSQLGKHLIKCFDGVSQLILDDELCVEAVVSTEGEVLELVDRISTKHAQLSIENWLLEFQHHLNQTVKHQIEVAAEWWAKSCSGKGLTRENLQFMLNNFPLQIILAVRLIFLSTEIVEAIRGGQEALKQCQLRIENDLKLLVANVRGTSSTRKKSTSSISSVSSRDNSLPPSGSSLPPSGSSLPPSGSSVPPARSSLAAVSSRDNTSVETNLDPLLLKNAITTLILSGVHSRDVLQQLLAAKVDDEGAFVWLSQLRLFLHNGPTVEAKLLEVSLPWGWEYVGAGGRLVSTPLTARAHLALAIAYKSHLGAAHEGPAGTGKTETVKDLARVLAMHCIVFNCSESVDSRGVASLLTGLAAAGSWLCLDEFNKFQVGVLSVAAQQLMAVISARRAHESTFSLSGAPPLALDPRGLMVVTLNPEYRGRVAIPDNLTLLLRPVAMLAADEQSIVEVWLMAIGFEHAYTLARRATRILAQCRTRLEPHSHYDFGLRTVRSVLTTAGKLREVLPDCSETEIMIRALREVNQPKLVGRDDIRFEEILHDFFPQMPPTPRPPEADLRQIFRQVCEKRGVCVTKEFESKAFQLLSTLQERTGILLVGDSCSAKSTIIKTLAETLKVSRNGQEIYIEVLNPKTVTQELLVGNLDSASRDWTDGKITIALRRSQKERVWILLDGPADASWVEQFNTALDDSKRLCLASGETLGIPPTLNIIFEVMDLSQASPAAVSRCGVVYVSESCISWHVLFHSWKNGCENPFTSESWWPNHISLLEDLVEWVIPPTETFLKINCQHVLPLKFIALVRPVFKLTATLIQEIEDASILPNKDRARLSDLCTIGAFFFAFAWSVGGALEVDSKERFSTFFRRLAYGEDKTIQMPPRVEKLGGCPYPSEGNIFEAAFDARQRSLWRPWNDVIKHMPLLETIPAANLFVPTTENVSLLHIMKIFNLARIPLMLVGRGGSGVRKTVQHYLQQLPKDSFASLHLPVTPAATSGNFKSRVLRYLESRSFCGRTNSKGQRILMAYVDDLHLAPCDDYEAVPIQEAVREAIQQKEWVDTENISKIGLANVQWLAGATLSAKRNGESDKNSLFDTRCLSCFLPIVAESLSEESTNKIFTTKVSHFLKNGGFVPDIFSVVTGLVSGLNDIYRYAKKHFTTTMEQPHYNFSLTTAARVLMGIFHVEKDSVESKRHFIRLWTHEMFREFCDRLTRTSEVEDIYEKLIDVISSSCKDKLKTIYEKVCYENGNLDLSCVQQIRWGVFGSFDKPIKDRRYEELPDEAKLGVSVLSFIQRRQQELSNERSDIVVFKYVLEHLSRACRVISRPGGNLLLVGDGGCGRKSLTKLAAFICGCRVQSPQINAFDDYYAVRESLKSAMLAASLEEVSTVVIIGDDVIQHPKVLHILHTILRTGHAPGILSMEDSCNLIERLRLNSDDPAIQEDDLWDLFTLRVTNNVHLVITSPPTPVLSRVLALFPALASQTTTDYYQAWPEDALTKVGEQSVASLHFRSKLRDEVVRAAIGIHNTARSESLESTVREGWCPKVTPASYLHLLQEFQGLYKSRLEKINSLINKYKSGLEKLHFAASQISVMKDMLASLGPQIEQASKDVSTMMAQIGQESADVETKRTIVAEEEEIAGVHAANARNLKDECQTDLNQALPALHAAAEALNTLKPSDITVVKSMKNPPQVVKIVMSAVCVMMDIKADKIKNASGKMVFDFWGPSKRLLGDLTFLQKLKDYDKDSISDTLMDRIKREFLDLPEFNPAVVAKASSAAEGLCKWVQAISEYYEIAKIVTPKRARLAAAEEEVRELMSLLDEKRNQLKILEEKLENLHKRFNVACAEKLRLEKEQKDCSLKLARAEKLIRGLGGEKDRWEIEKEETEEQLRKLPGDSLLAAASLAYLAPHPPFIREIQTRAWTRVIHDVGLEVITPFNIVSVLASPLDLRAWSLEGLPADTFSSENAIFIKNSVKWPMLVDPDDQGTHWLERHERRRGLVVIRAQDANTLIESSFAGGANITLLENALAKTIPHGRPLLLKDLHGEPPPLLQPLLQKCIVTEAGMQTITMGSLKLKYKNEFRLYLATRQVRPNLPRESINNINLINFTVTLHGLSDLLRQVLVQHERPELEDERERLATAACEVQRRLQETEAKILHTLAAAQGNILESEEAIQVLQEAKQMSNELKQKEAEGIATEKTILEYCRKYEAVSRPAARLYLLVASLPNLSNIYQFSLTWFMKLYIQVIKESGKSSVLERRLNLLQERLLSSVHQAVIKSLAVPHRLPFSVMLALHTLSIHDRLADDEHTWLLQLSRKLGLESSPVHPPPDWLPQPLCNVWPLLHSLDELEVFRDVMKSFQTHSSQWLDYLEDDEPSFHKLPKPWSDLQPLHALILVSVICPRQVLKTAVQMVCKVLGPTFATQPTYDLVPLLQYNAGGKGGSPSHQPLPLLLVTVPGVDALDEVMKLASRKPDLNLSVVSLGQGQEQAAESAISIALHTGGWVILQNLHHASTWLPTLARIVNEIGESYQETNKPFGSEPHPEFRMILTTQPTEDFPVSLLRQVEKIAVAPPVDAKAGLVAAVDAVVKESSTWGLDDLDMDAEEAATLHRLLHGLAVFHVLVSERGRHGNRAWAAAPTFTQADLVLSLSCVRSMVEAGRNLETSALEHIIGRIIYAGRVRHPQDEFVILSLLREVLRIALATAEESASLKRELPEGYADGDEDLEETEKGIESLFTDFIGEMADLIPFTNTIEGLDDPELFGLPRSVKSIQAAKEGEELLTALTNLGGSVEEFSTEEETVSSLLLHTKNRLPPLIVLQERFLLQITDKDMSDVLQRETEGLNATIHGAKNTIDNAILLLKTGNCNGKEDVAEDVAKNIPLGRTPSIWRSLDSLPTPQILQSFLNLLWMRNAFFNQWIIEECPTKFWLGSFQFLPAFLSLVLRQASLCYRVPLHLVDWKFTFTEDPSPDPSFLLKEVLANHTDHRSSEDMTDSLDSEKVETEEKEDSAVPILEQSIGSERNTNQSRWREMSKDGLHVYGLWLVGAAWDVGEKVLYDAPGRQVIQLLPILIMTPSIATSCGDLTERELQEASLDEEHEQLHSSPSNIKKDQEDGECGHSFSSKRELQLPDDVSSVKKLNFGKKDSFVKEEKDVDVKNERQTEHYSCPVYEGSPENSQSPVVFSVPFPAGPKGANHWVQRRVAIYTSKI